MGENYFRYNFMTGIGTEMVGGGKAERQGGRPAREVLAERLKKRGVDLNEPARHKRHALARALTAMRIRRGLSQDALGKRAGWDQSFVARMESATGPWPKRENIARYAEICGYEAGYVFGHREDDRFHVDAAVGLTGEDPSGFEQALEGEVAAETDLDDETQI